MKNDKRLNYLVDLADFALGEIINIFEVEQKELDALEDATKYINSKLNLLRGNIEKS